MANSKARSLVDGKVLRHKTLWLICVNPSQHTYTYIHVPCTIYRAHQLIHYALTPQPALYIIHTYAHNDIHNTATYINNSCTCEYV